jgi:heme exporter protein A
MEKAEVRAELGWVSHETMAYRELTGLENVRLVAELSGLGEAAIQAVAERTRLGKFASKPVATMSRGQKQRIALARALVHRPSLLLLDEPWTGLDSEASSDLERLILEEQARGTIIVVVSHEASVAERINGTPLWLLRGKLSRSPSLGDQ